MTIWKGEKGGQEERQGTMMKRERGCVYPGKRRSASKHKAELTRAAVCIVG